MREPRRRRFPSIGAACLAGAWLLLAGPPSWAGEGDEVLDLPVSAPACRMSAVGSAAYEPYHYLDGGRPTGFDVELLQAVADVMGMDLQVRLGHWAEAREALADGTADVHIGMNLPAGPGRTYLRSTPYLTQQLRIFVRADNTSIRGPGDLAGRRIVVPHDGDLPNFVRAQGYAEQPLLAESVSEAMRLVAAGEADCCLVSEYRGLYVLQQSGLENLVRVGSPVATTDYGFAVRPGRRDILLRLNLGLAIVDKLGEYDRIYSKWFGILEPKPTVWEYAKYAAWVLVPLLATLGLAFLWTWSLRRQVARRTAELALARDQAEAASAAKSAFLTTISHELRTPLNAVVGMSELLRTTGLDATQKEHLAVVARAAASLQDIIGDILVIAENERGIAGSGHARVTFDLARLVEERVQEVAAAIAPKGLELRLELDPTLPVRAVGDAAGLERVLRHLLDNAVKFTNRGYVELRLSGTRVGEERVRLDGAVVDTGIGILPAAREEIFAAFSQVDSTSTRRYAGTGLGLAVCRALLRRMGGDVMVDEGPDGGSIFTFSALLGIAAAVAAAPAPATPAVAPEPDSRPILVVEDNATNLRVVSLLLRKWGYEFVSAENGAAAVQAFRDGEFGAVLMDCQMPVMDGLEAARAIRDIEDGSRRVPIIALTAGAFGSDRERCLEAGMDDYLTKPVNASQLRQALQMWLAMGNHVPV